MIRPPCVFAPMRVVVECPFQCLQIVQTDVSHRAVLDINIVENFVVAPAPSFFFWVYIFFGVSFYLWDYVPFFFLVFAAENPENTFLLFLSKFIFVFYISMFIVRKKFYKFSE